MEIGASTLAYTNLGVLEAVERLMDKFDIVEIILAKNHVWPRDPDIWEIASKLRDLGARYIVHAPVTDINVASPIDELRAKFVEIISDGLRFADRIDAELYVVHPGYKSPLAREDEARRFSKEEITRLRAMADILGVELSVENMPNLPGMLGRSIEEMREYSKLGARITLDVGHAATCGDPIEYIDSLVDSIASMHLSDNDGREDQHKPLGKGSIGIERILERAGDLYAYAIIEVHTEEELLESIRFLEDLGYI